MLGVIGGLCAVYMYPSANGKGSDCVWFIVCFVNHWPFKRVRRILTEKT